MKKMLKRSLPRIIGRYFNTMNRLRPNWTGKQLTYLFCTPRKGSIRPDQAQFIATSQSTTLLESPEGPIQLYRWNETAQQKVLLLHGWESNAARWRWLIPLLVEEGYQVLAIDAPAHGGSGRKHFDIPAYTHFLQQTLLTHPADFAIGHSLGGATLAYYSAKYDGHKPAKIILLGVPSELSRMIELFATALQLKPSSIQSLYRYFEQHFQLSVADFSVKDFCQSIDLPTLLIHDHQDEIAKIADSIEYHQRLTQSELFMTDGFGHSLQDEKVYNKIIDYLKS